jgi:hypothetical protein
MSAIEVWGHGDIRKVMAELDEHGFVLDQFKPQGSGMLVWFFVGNSAGEAIACSVWTRSPEHFARQLTGVAARVTMPWKRRSPVSHRLKNMSASIRKRTLGLSRFP